MIASGAGRRVARTRGDVRPLVLQWHITERCNFRCAHCYQDRYAGDEFDIDAMVDVLDQYVALLHHWQREVHPRPAFGQINVTGGEPLVHRDLFPLLERIASHPADIEFGILSNGSLIDDATARRLAELGPLFVQVSLEGGPETNDRVRGDGSFERVVRGLEHLVRHRVSCRISFTAQRSQYREFETVARVGCDVGVNRVWSDRLIPWGSGGEAPDELLSPEETRQYFEVMRRARQEVSSTFGPTRIVMGRALQFLVGGGEPYRCAAGDTLLALTPDGDVYPCRRMPIKVGNVHDSTLDEIYHDSPLLRRLRSPDAVPDACGSCRFGSRCGGGLRCLSYAVTGDPFRADPGCWHTDQEN